MSKWESFFRNLQQDFKLYVFILGVFCAFRLGFIVWLQSYLQEATEWRDIVMAMYYGLRISLKSAAFAGAASLLLCTGGSLVLGGKAAARLRWGLGGLYTTVLSLLFYARIPYYEQFHSGFNQFIFNTLNDDVHALWVTMIEEYQLPLRLALTLVTGVLLTLLLRKWLSTRTYALPRFDAWYKNAAARALVLILVYNLMVFVRFGGSMTYAYNVDWENAGVTKDQFLNEAILDDVQALMRAYALHERIAGSTGLNMDPARMMEYGSYVAGKNLVSGSLDEYLAKQAQGRKGAPPRHVFVIIGESYANWPLLPQYQQLGIAQGVKNIIASENASYTAAFLPNGMSTVSAVMGVVTGFADANMYLTYLPQAYQEVYPTAIAPQMKKLGYKPRFWYGGPSSWERVKDFTLAQGFEEFYGMGDITSQAGNVWGCDDKYLFAAVSQGMQTPEPTFNVILNSSNHAPYTVNLEAEGFDTAALAAVLPPGRSQDKELIKKLGHFWYADREIAAFVERTRQQYPDSLFVIVGDHADRVNIDLQPSLYERYGIPFIVCGQGVTKDSLPKDSAGSHINVGATLLELVAPAGFTYYSLGDSLTRGNQLAFNYELWMSAGHIGKIGNSQQEHIPGVNVPQPAAERVQQDVDARRAVAWWRIKYGSNLSRTEE